MIAGLVSAGDLARVRGDTARSGLWTGVADAWQRNTEKWMFTTTGPVGDGRYYVRIDDDGDPDDGSEREYANGAGVHKENSVLDGGFLDLVRLGVKAPSDPYVADSIAETDFSLAKDTPSGRVWYRYTFDGYGEQADGSAWEFGKVTFGRPWPILTGERGEYEIANGRNGMAFLQAMANTANEGYMIPEQVWDTAPPPPPFNYQPGEATGSAAPLAWAMAQYIRLSWAIDAGRPVETPAVVAQRYAQGAQRSVPTLELTAPTDGTVADEREVTVRGTTNGQKVYVGLGGQVFTATPQNGVFEVLVPSALGGLNLATARYGVAMFGNSEAGEGIGFIRPVYSLDFWNNGPAFVKQFRFGGGAGELDFGLESKDTDTRDPNALDVIVGPGQSQSSVLDWQTASPVQLPMLEFAP